MPENDRERTVGEMERTFYEAISKNTFFSSLNRSASALENLSDHAKALTEEIKRSGESSSRLAKSLNKLTLAAVVIAVVALTLEAWKMFNGV